MKPWETCFYIGSAHFPFDTTYNGWTVAWTVYSKVTRKRVTERKYSREIDAKRGAAQIYNNIEKTLLK